MADKVSVDYLEFAKETISDTEYLEGMSSSYHQFNRLLRLICALVGVLIDSGELENSAS